MIVEDILNGYFHAKIRCAVTNRVVRELTVVANGVFVQPETGDPVVIPLDTEVRYEPWFLDRGSILFGEKFKLCTEYDIVEHPGTDTRWHLFWDHTVGSFRLEGLQ